MSGRRVCAQCGASYHINSNPPKSENICDKCGAGLIQRLDDKEETVLERLKVYHQQTEPLIKYYIDQGKLVEVNGVGSIEDNSIEMLNKLSVE